MQPMSPVAVLPRAQPCRCRCVEEPALAIESGFSPRPCPIPALACCAPAAPAAPAQEQGALGSAGRARQEQHFLKSPLSSVVVHLRACPRLSAHPEVPGSWDAGGMGQPLAAAGLVTGCRSGTCCPATGSGQPSRSAPRLQPVSAPWGAGNGGLSGLRKKLGTKGTQRGCPNYGASTDVIRKRNN